MAKQTSAASLIAEYYSKRCEAWDAIEDLHIVILKHGNKKYFIHHVIMKEAGKILKNNDNSFYCEINKMFNELLFYLNMDLIQYRKNDQNEVIIRLIVYV